MQLQETDFTRWLPSALLDYPPTERVRALRTPHRVLLQGLPASRDALAALLDRDPFEMTIELETTQSPLLQAPLQEVHEVRLLPNLVLDWSQFYWLLDGILSDLYDSAQDPAAAFAHGNQRLLALEDELREEPTTIFWSAELVEKSIRAQKGARSNGKAPLLEPYIRSLSEDLVTHSTSEDFVQVARALMDEAAQRPDLGLPSLTPPACRLLALYAQHRLLGSPCLVAPVGFMAGWRLQLSVHVLSVWYAGLLVQTRREKNLDQALVTSFWMLDQGLWRDDVLVHDFLRRSKDSPYTPTEFVSYLATATRGTGVRA